MVNIYIENYGCSANKSNAEIMMGLLEQAGHVIVDDIKQGKADIIILNTCIVKGPTEKKAIKRIREIRKTKKNMIITGCMPEAQFELVKNLAPKAILIGPSHIKDIVKAADILLNKEEKQDFTGEQHEIKLLLPKHRYNPVIDIIQISEGCDGNCSYCITRHAKGKLRLYSPEKIISEAKTAIEQGCKEIWLTSQDCASYDDLPDLLHDIAGLEGDFFVRVGMMNPNKVLPILDELIESFKNEKIFKFIHIPVQSGNDEILKKMNRNYTSEDFKDIIKRLRKAIPKITISTDIICGFPTETTEQFDDSIKLIKEIKPDVMNISRFWPRPGTPAEKMEQHASRITKDRSRELTEEFHRIALKKNQKYIGWKGKALIDEYGKQGTDTLIARNSFYRPVIVKQNKNKKQKLVLGDFVDVEIKDATSFDLRS
ncbi:tRNA (N(6)-L-threonylcarbamoyladenosine(37)-C(2))-methylthiotransferase [Thermoproteota archaeon]